MPKQNNENHINVDNILPFGIFFSKWNIHYMNCICCGESLTKPATSGMVTYTQQDKHRKWNKRRHTGSTGWGGTPLIRIEDSSGSCLFFTCANILIRVALSAFTNRTRHDLKEFYKTRNKNSNCDLVLEFFKINIDVVFNAMFQICRTIEDFPLVSYECAWFVYLFNDTKIIINKK